MPFSVNALLRVIAVLCLGLLVGCRKEGKACEISGTRVEFVTGSRLASGSPGHLTLASGQLADCDANEYAQTQKDIREALGVFPVRLPKLTVHVRPEIPQEHGALGPIEVHVGSREVLLSVVGTGLGVRPWVHELAHVIARPAPVAPMARRIWITIEEAFVQVLEVRLLGKRKGTPEPATPAELLPWEMLAEPQYDPHWLAESLVVQLESIQALDVDTVVSCLVGSAAESDALASSLKTAVAQYGDGCPAEVRPDVRRALRGWLPESLGPSE